MTIGEKIRKIRKENGLTQKQLGEKLGVSYQMIAQYENGKRNPKIDTIEKIADALEVSKNSFYDNFTQLEKGEMVKSDLIDIIKKLNLEVERITDKDGNIEKALTKSVEKKREYICLYDQLNSNGQDKAIEQVELLTKIPEYRKDE